MSRKFKTGDKVRMIGGSTEMCVAGYDDEGRVICQFEDGGARIEYFDELTLELAATDGTILSQPSASASILTLRINGPRAGPSA